MKLKEKLELLVAFLAFRDKMVLAEKVEHLLDLIQERRYPAIVTQSRQLGLTNEDIKELLWEARCNYA